MRGAAALFTIMRSEMTGWLLALTVTMAAVLGNTVALEKQQQGLREAQQQQQQGLWPPSEGLLLGLEEWFNSPAQRAAEGFPRILTGNETQYDKSALANWVWMYLPSTNPDIVKNEACRNDVNSIYKTLTNSLIYYLVLLKKHYWPLMLPDSWGKVPDGMMDGNLQPWGMMEECIELHVDEFINNLINTTFDGKYCAVSFSDLKNNTDEVSPSPQPRILAVIPSFSIFYYGTCMPSSCTADDLRVTLDDRLRTFGKKALTVDCQTMHDTVDLNAADIAVIVILSIFGVLLLAGAACDISINFYNKQHFRKGPLRFLLVFSAYSNMKKIFTINKKENPEVISCIHGMRVLSMTWVVWGHTFLILFFSSTNILGIRSVTDNVIDQTVDNATFSVDTFFFIGGLLLTYGILSEYSRVGKVNWIMYYVHRFIRLAPPIALTGAVVATISRLALYGPLSGYVDRTLIQNCRDFWWADFLFATNFLDLPCLAQCWYTAADTQVYVVLPIVLIPLIYRRKIGIAFLAVVTVISLAIPTIISAVYNVPPTLFFAEAEVARTKNVDTYETPWCRANSIIVGVWAGLLLFSVKGRNIKLKLWQTLLGWAVATTIAALVLYGMAKYDTWVDRVVLPQAPSIVYAGFSRAAWCLALLWVVFACHTGHGSLINSFLAHPSWQPLSRLTYTMYLVVMPLQQLYMGLVYTPVYINYLTSIVNTCGFLFISGMLAVILSLMTEGPVIGMEKLLIQRRGRGIADAANGVKSLNRLQD